MDRAVHWVKQQHSRQRGSFFLQSACNPCKNSRWLQIQGGGDIHGSTIQTLSLGVCERSFSSPGATALLSLRLFETLTDGLIALKKKEESCRRKKSLVQVESAERDVVILLRKFTPWHYEEVSRQFSFIGEDAVMLNSWTCAGLF